MMGLTPVTGVKQGAAQSWQGPQSVAPGVAGGLGFQSWMHTDVGQLPTFTDAAQPHCDNTRLLQGLGRMMGVRLSREPPHSCPKAGVRGGPSPGVDEEKKLQGLERCPLGRGHVRAWDLVAHPKQDGRPQVQPRGLVTLCVWP